MPRLKIVEPRQRGFRTGAATADPPLSPARSSRGTPRKTPQTSFSSPPAARKRRKVLSPNSQAAVAVAYTSLPGNQYNPEWRKGLTALCLKYDVHRQYPAKIVKKLKTVHRLSKAGKPGRKPVIGAEEEQIINDLLQSNGYAMTFQQLEVESGISHSTIQRFMAKRKYRSVSKSTCPKLSQAQQEARLAWATEHQKNDWHFHVDIDEKWFYVYQHSGRLKIPPGKEKPKQALQSKRFVNKVMLLCAIARPNERYSFSGLVGCWRVCKQRPCERGNKKIGRKKGDLITEDVTLDANKFEDMLRQDVFPAIRQKLRGADRVYVQMDNATPHKSKTMEDRLADDMKAPHDRSRHRTGPEICFVRQPANSPDTNACDLGFFKSMDSRLPTRRSFDLDQFAEECFEAFWNTPTTTLNALFDTKNRICQAIIEHEGGNNFKIPHSKKVSRRGEATG